MDYYIIDASSNVEEYLKLGKDIVDKIGKACVMSEFQYLDRSVLSSELDEKSGRVCQDFIYDHGIPLVSEKLKDFFDTLGIDYLFYKKIILTKSSAGIAEPYWLALPQRINCLNFEKSAIDPYMNSVEKDGIVINDSKVGRFDIFKLGGATKLGQLTNLEIIVTENLANKLKEKKFKGLHIYRISSN